MTIFATTDAGQSVSGSPGAVPHTQTVAGVWVVVGRVDRTGANQRVWLRYGDHRLRLPPAIATLVLAQRDQASTASAIGRSHPNGVSWLFPGGFPGSPARDALYRGLREHPHVHLRRTRSAALASLAAELPAAVVAHLLDININTAIARSTYAQTD